MPYHTNDYKEALQSTLLSKRTISPARYTYQNMAKACRVQKTYLSKVFRDEHTQLNRDQVYLSCEFLGFTSHETDYVLTLHEYARSTLPKRRNDLLLTIKAQQQKHNRTDNHITATKVVVPLAEDLSIYFLEPYAQLVHMFLTIEKYRKDTRKISTALDITGKELSRIIQILQRLNLIEIDGANIRVLADHLHLPVDSSSYKPYRILARQNAISKIQRTSPDDNYLFSVMFSSSQEVRDNIQKKFLAFLKDIEKNVQAGPAEDVFQMNFDLLKWS